MGDGRRTLPDIRNWLKLHCWSLSTKYQWWYCIQWWYCHEMASVAQKLPFLGHFFSFFSLFLQIFGVHEHNHSHFVVIMYQYTHLTTGTIKLPIFDWLIFSQSASWLKSVGVKENIYCLKWSGWAPMSKRVQHLAGQTHLLKVASSFDVKWWLMRSFFIWIW